MKRILPRALQIAIVLVILGFLIAQVVRNWRQVSGYHWHASPGWVAVSFLLLLMTLGLDAVIWRLALRMFQAPLGFRAAARIWFPALIARYIPGKVASLALRIWLSEREGVSPYRAGGAAFFEIALRVMAALIVFGASLPFWPSIDDINRLAALVIIVPAGVIALHPRLLQRALNLVLKVLKRPAVMVPFRFRDVMLLLGLLCGRWILFGFSFARFAAAIAPDLWAHLPAIIGMCSISWAAGFLSLLAPAGLGVYEGVLTLALGQYVLAPIAIVTALLGRLWTVAAEVTWLAALPLLRRGPREG